MKLKFWSLSWDLRVSSCEFTSGKHDVHDVQSV
jgi:hypothetical protein